MQKSLYFKHLEHSYMFLEFNKNLKLENIPDKCILDMLEYI